ncbi:MAG: hypothetical protein E3K37_02130 [Candidatus Kuenenia sp.]|nr:hypothetical protein [Candidatus Kuenenia hertensis]
MKTVSMMIFMLFFCAYVVNAEPYAVGSQIPSISLSDQHEQKRTVDKTIRLIIFSNNKVGSDIVRDSLNGVDEEYLTTHKTIYIADISGMPGLIRKLFAFPKMRKQPYSIYLDDGPSFTRDFPAEENKVTLLYLNNLKIQAIEFASLPDEVRNAIEKSKAN